MNDSPTVMIVDDEQTMRSLLIKLLRQCGCEVIGQAEDGKSAYSLFLDKRPNILFLDINMPKLNGIELLEKIREEDKEVHICMVSADAFTDVVKKAAGLGISGFIVKPLTIHRIEAFINRTRKAMAAAKTADAS